MARRVVSLLRSAPVALRPDPALEANAYALAEDVDLVVVLQGAAVEHAVAGAAPRPGVLAGIPLSPARCALDLQGLVESGVRVVAAAEDLRARGIAPDELLAGVDTAEPDAVAGALRDADAVVCW